MPKNNAKTADDRARNKSWWLRLAKLNDQAAEAHVAIGNLRRATIFNIAGIAAMQIHESCPRLDLNQKARA